MNLKFFAIISTLFLGISSFAAQASAKIVCAKQGQVMSAAPARHKVKCEAKSLIGRTIFLEDQQEVDTVHFAIFGAKSMKLTVRNSGCTLKQIDTITECPNLVKQLKEQNINPNDLLSETVEGAWTSVELAESKARLYTTSGKSSDTIAALPRYSTESLNADSPEIVYPGEDDPAAPASSRTGTVR